MEMATQMNIECRTIDDFRKVRIVMRGASKRDRSNLKRQVRINTLRSLTQHEAPYSFQARRAYRKLWHEATGERERIILAKRAINATA